MISRALIIRGDLQSAQVLPWIEHRARLLDLKGWVARRNAQALEVALWGPEPLIDALEVACLLGPADVQVDTIQARSHQFDATPNGFAIVSTAPAA